MFFLARLTQVTCGWAVLKSGQGRALTKPQDLTDAAHSKSVYNIEEGRSLVSRYLDFKIKDSSPRVRGTPCQETNTSYTNRVRREGVAPFTCLSHRPLEVGNQLHRGLDEKPE